MKGIKEINDPKDADITYPITLLWVDDKGEKLITQAIYPANLKEYLEDKKVAKVGMLYFMGQPSNVTTVESLEMFCND